MDISVFLSTINLDITIRIITIIVGTIIVNYIVRKFIRLPHRLETKRARTLLSLVQSSISIIIFLIGIALILKVLQIDITPLIAGAGIVGIAVGFGSQALVKDLIAGLFLLAEDSISVGDMVEIGSNRGIVQKITIRTITLKDENGALRIIPAGQIQSVINLSREDARVTIEIPFKPEVKIEKVFKAIRDELKLLSADKRFEKILIKKPELKGLENIEPRKIFVQTVLYCRANDQWRLKREFLYRVKKRFEKDEIELA